MGIHTHTVHGYICFTCMRCHTEEYMYDYAYICKYAYTHSHMLAGVGPCMSMAKSISAYFVSCVSCGVFGVLHVVFQFFHIHYHV